MSFFSKKKGACGKPEGTFKSFEDHDLDYDIDYDLDHDLNDIDHDLNG